MDVEVRTGDDLVSQPVLWAALVTYRRPAEVRTMLTILADQSRPPDRLIVVDNGSDSVVRALVEEAGGLYVDPGDNLGPAGGYALAMTTVLVDARDEDWVLLLDDDDPPRLPDALETVWTYARQMDPALNLGAVGLHGGDYNYRRGVFRRLEDAEWCGDVEVCVIAGGAHPLYRCHALREVGVMDAGLFFGFEEGELGLRLRAAGYRLLVPGHDALRWRAASGTLGRASATVRTNPEKAAWRRYYSIRNSTIVARRYATTPWAPLYVAFGGATKGVWSMVRSRRSIGEVGLAVRGAVDGLRDQRGRTINPYLSTK